MKAFDSVGNDCKELYGKQNPAEIPEIPYKKTVYMP